MIASNKFNVFLCLAVLSFTAASEEKPYFSDHVTEIQAVTSLHHENNNDDLDLCLLKPAKKVSHVYCQDQYYFQNSKQKYFNYLPKSPRGPPVI